MQRRGELGGEVGRVEQPGPDRLGHTAEQHLHRPVHIRAELGVGWCVVGHERPENQHVLGDVFV